MIFQVLALILLSADAALPYRPVVLVHGLFGSNDTWLNTTNLLQHKFPGINITISRKYNGMESVTNNLWTQVEGTYLELKDVLTGGGKGVTLICYSQGVLVCRGMLQTYSDLNIHTFISLSGPLAGQFGLTDVITKYINKQERKEVYKIVYNDFIQQTFSIANYWNDPFHQDLFKEKCLYLPKLNSCTDCYKNFVKINQVVLIGGPEDKVVTPWQSSHFGFYADNSTTEVISMNNTKIYQEDTFGLKTLNEKGKMEVLTVHDVRHMEWTHKRVFDCCIKQWIN